MGLILREGTFIELLKNNIMRKMKEIEDTETKPFKYIYIYIYIYLEEKIQRIFFIFLLPQISNLGFLTR